MNKILIVFGLISTYLVVGLASDQHQAVFNIIKQSYESSLPKLTGEQRNNLKQFKLILSKDKKAYVEDPFAKISDEVLTKAVSKYLKTKAGPYHPDTVREEEFVQDCNDYLVTPCEQLRSYFKLPMVLYYARAQEKDFVATLKTQYAEQYDLLETAGVCETLIKTTSSICTKSFNYMKNKKSSQVLGKLRSCFKS